MHNKKTPHRILIITTAGVFSILQYSHISSYNLYYISHPSCYLKRGNMSNVFDFPDIAASIQTVAKETIASVLEAKRYTPGETSDYVM